MSVDALAQANHQSDST